MNETAFLKTLDYLSESSSILIFLVMARFVILGPDTFIYS